MRRRRSLCLALTLSAVAFSSSTCANSNPTVPTITPTYAAVAYGVLGTAKHVVITYQDSQVDVSRAPAMVPYFNSWTRPVHGTALIAAQIDTDGDAGTINRVYFAGPLAA